MRPVNRGNSPRERDFEDYREAFHFLAGRLGLYCSYCERPIVTNLAVEHIQPKGLPKYKGLIGRWDNFLLGCVNCNGTKTDKDVMLARILLPDRDNTGVAFDYSPDGKVSPAAIIKDTKLAKMAKDTLALVGLDKPINEIKDENGQLVALDRVAQRMEAWAMAEESRQDLQQQPSDSFRRQVLRTAKATGFFSIWMAVFKEDTQMLRLLINGFPGTAKNCYDAQAKPISPRPVSGLPNGRKI